MFSSSTPLELETSRLHAEMKKTKAKNKLSPAKVITKSLPKNSFKPVEQLIWILQVAPAFFRGEAYVENDEGNKQFDILLPQDICWYMTLYVLDNKINAELEKLKKLNLLTANTIPFSMGKNCVVNIHNNFFRIMRSKNPTITKAAEKKYENRTNYVLTSEEQQKILSDLNLELFDENQIECKREIFTNDVSYIKSQIASNNSLYDNFVGFFTTYSAFDKTEPLISGKVGLIRHRPLNANDIQPKHEDPNDDSIYKL